MPRPGEGVIDGCLAPRARGRGPHPGGQRPGDRGAGARLRRLRQRRVGVPAPRAPRAPGGGLVRGGPGQRQRHLPGQPEGERRAAAPRPGAALRRRSLQGGAAGRHAQRRGHDPVPGRRARLSRAARGAAAAPGATARRPDAPLAAVAGAGAALAAMARATGAGPGRRRLRLPWLPWLPRRPHPAPPPRRLLPGRSRRRPRPTWRARLHPPRRGVLRGRRAPAPRPPPATRHRRRRRAADHSSGWARGVAAAWPRC
jgi:hypothetical protein